MTDRRDPGTVAVHVALDDTPGAIPALAQRIASAGGTIRTLSTVRRVHGEAGGRPGAVEVEIEVDGIAEDDLQATIRQTPALQNQRLTRALVHVFGKRIIVVGGGAQVAQVALGAVSEADRHNLRGERISVDTIPLVGEDEIAAAVRAVADLPRARLLVLAGSIMGGEISSRRRRAPRDGDPDHRPEHGRLDHRARRSRRLRSRPGRHDGRHGDRRDCLVRPRPPTRPAVLRALSQMRIATWNVNSLKARLEKVEWWVERAAPDVLLIQETKLTDADAPLMPFRMLGYEFLHHGEGRWNGVAIASRLPLGGDVVTNFGDGPVRDSGPGAERDFSEEDFNPFDEARMLSTTIAGIRFVSLYAPNGRVVGSPFFTGKLAWYERLAGWLAEAADPKEPLVIGGDFNVAPADEDVWDARKVHGGTHVSAEERAAFRSLLDWGLVDSYRSRRPEPGRFTWWDYRAGNFHKNLGMRIDHLLVTKPVAERVEWAEIDREARKGKPIPSDHAPLLVDLDEPGTPLDAGWESASERIAARRGVRPT